MGPFAVDVRSMGRRAGRRCPCSSIPAPPIARPPRPLRSGSGCPRTVRTPSGLPMAGKRSCRMLKRASEWMGETPTLLILTGRRPLLGAYALERLGLQVDPGRKRPVPAEGFLG